ncbi:MAG: roadblock/LC7 domain-containing protein [candidate division Zixibacteria bacterium]|nr:roadblock/LC7 domain-containing protein [candidate division Zixibacteria bacterium]
MLAAIKEKKVNMFHNALEYLSEYRGVNKAIIFDSDGLVIGMAGENETNNESFSALMLLMLDQMNHILKRLDENPAKKLVIKSDDSWLTLERIGNLILVVNANSETDELLKVRFGQAVEMIKTHLVDNYPLLSK